MRLLHLILYSADKSPNNSLLPTIYIASTPSATAGFKRYVIYSSKDSRNQNPKRPFKSLGDFQETKGTTRQITPKQPNQTWTQFRMIWYMQYHRMNRSCLLFLIMWNIFRPLQDGMKNAQSTNKSMPWVDCRLS